MRPVARACVAALAVGVAGLPAPSAGQQPGGGATVAPPPGISTPLVQRPRQEFVPTPSGSYRLPPIQQAADGWVFEGNWLPRRLARYTTGAITLLSFVYTYCTDPDGCPLAYVTMAELKQRVLADPALHGKVRFVSLSFDPANDTPEAMRAYGGEHLKSDGLAWHFLTTWSARFLLPILDGFGQDVEVETDARGAPTRARTHMLKVFLIDRRARVREIYSAAFLHPDVMFNDIKTLAIEARDPDTARAADEFAD